MPATICELFKAQPPYSHAHTTTAMQSARMHARVAGLRAKHGIEQPHAKELLTPHDPRVLHAHCNACTPYRELSGAVRDEARVVREKDREVREEQQAERDAAPVAPQISRVLSAPASGTSKRGLKTLQDSVSNVKQLIEPSASA